LRAVGVLAEPLSVAEKAIDEALSIQASRLPGFGDDWIKGKRVLVAGIGAIGLLAAIVLRLRGATVFGLDIVDPHTKRPALLTDIGGQYIDARSIAADAIDDQLGEMDFIFEATGVADLSFNLIDALGVNGVYVMTGIPKGDRPVNFHGASVMTQMVLKNQLILGSVNAGPKHFAMAIQDLEAIRNTWPSLPEALITTRIGYENFRQALDFRSEDDIKTVVVWH
jgi:threonine dehydrogenase-like Zn-dependent dehydrogenase